MKLGFECNEEIRNDTLQSPMLAVSSMPMYYVAAVLEFKEDSDLPESLLNDIFGVNRLREAFAANQVTQDMHLCYANESQLRALLVDRRKVDVIIYEFAVETIKMYLQVATPEIAAVVRNVVARGMVEVATASGNGWFGSGAEATAEQLDIISQIRDELQLDKSEVAKRFLDQLRN